MSSTDVEYRNTECSWRQCLKHSGWLFAFFLGLFAFLNFVFVPAIFYSSPPLRRRVIFWNSYDPYPMLYNAKAERYGVECTMNSYLPVGVLEVIGVWEMANKDRNCEMFASEQQVVMILHGNAGSRRSPRRIKMYEHLRALGVDVVAFDYRGYGDSSGSPSAEGAVEDTFSVYNHIRKHVPANRIFVYGHSLGTGVATKFLARLNETIAGLILEAPFDKIGNVLLYHPAAVTLRLLPCFEAVFVDGINNHTETSLNSIDYVPDIDVNIPLYIFATEDDRVVPAVLAENLYNRFVEFRTGKENVFLKIFEARFGYGHQPLHASGEALGILADFLGKKREVHAPPRT